MSLRSEAGWRFGAAGAWRGFCRRPMVLVCGGLLLFRLVLGIALWATDRTIQDTEELARYTMVWVQRDMQPEVPDGLPHWWFEFVPWLPLMFVVLRPFFLLGEFRYPAILALVGICSALATVLCAVTAYRAAGRRWEAALLAGAILAASPLFNLISLAILSEPFHFLSLSAATYAAWLLIEKPSPQARVLFWTATIMGQLNRYESWPVAAVMAALVAPRDSPGRFARHMIPAFAVPAFWLACNHAATGNAFHFLTLTQNQFAVNASFHGAEIASTMLRSMVGIPALSMLVGAIPCLRRSNRSIGNPWVLAMLSPFLTAVLLGLTMGEMGAFGYPGRMLLGPFVLSTPFCAALVVASVRDRWKGASRVLPFACVALAAYGACAALSARSYLRDYGFPQLCHLIREAGPGTRIRIEENPFPWTMTMASLAGNDAADDLGNTAELSLVPIEGATRVILITGKPRRGVVYSASGGFLEPPNPRYGTGWYGCIAYRPNPEPPPGTATRNGGYSSGT